MADEPNLEDLALQQSNSPGRDAYDEFEVGEHKVPWFLWVFFILIVCWASISWIPFFGY